MEAMTTQKWAKMLFVAQFIIAKSTALAKSEIDTQCLCCASLLAATRESVASAGC